MSVAVAALRSALWNHGGKILEYLLMFLASLLIARGLGVHDNGAFASFISLSQLLFVLSSLGLETAINTRFPQRDDVPGGGSGRGLILRRLLALRALLFACAAGILFLALRYGTPWFSGPAGDYVVALLAYACTRSLIPLLAMTLTADLRTDLTAGINLAVRAFELAALWWYSVSGLTLDVIYRILILSGILQLVAYLIVCRRTLTTPGSPAAVRPIVAFGALYWINTGVDYILGRHGDVFFLSRLLPDPSQASLYDVAYSILQLAQLGATAGFGGVTLAVFASLAVRSPGRMAGGYLLLVRVVSLLTIPLFSFLVFNAGPVVYALYPAAFAMAASLVQGMALFRIASRLFAGGENAEVLLALGKVSSLVKVGVAAAGVNVLLNLALIPPLGAAGSVIASGAANLSANVMGYALVRRRITVSLQLPFWAKLAGLSLLLSYGVTWFDAGSASLTVLVRGGGFLACVGAALLFLPAIAPGDRKRIRSMVTGLLSGKVQEEDVT